MTSCIMHCVPTYLNKHPDCKHTMYNPSSSLMGEIQDTSGDGDQNIVTSYDGIEHTTLCANMSLSEFSTNFRDVHGTISMLLCVLGIVANVSNILVLTRKKLVSPSNYILASIGTADMCALFIYGMFAAYAFISKRGEHYEMNEYREWTDYAIATKHLFHIFSICGAWLTIALAVFQYIQVFHVKLGQKFCTLKNTKIMIACTVVWSLISSIPLFIFFTSEWSDWRKKWKIVETDMVYYNRDLKNFTLIFYGTIFKLATCALLIVLSTLILVAIFRANKQSLRLRKNSCDHKRDAQAKNRRRNRTTIMMICVLLIFVLSTLPSGIVALIAGCSDDFERNVFVNLIDLFDMFVLINCAVKFVLYCSMSQEFRKVFVSTIDSNIRELMIRFGFKNIQRRRPSRNRSMSSNTTAQSQLDGMETHALQRMDDDDDEVFHPDT